MNNKQIKYEARHSFNYHCPCENDDEFNLWINELKVLWHEHQRNNPPSYEDFYTDKESNNRYGPIDET